MSIETICTGCGRKLRVADEHAGKQARCPICNTIYTVSPADVGVGGPAVENDSPPNSQQPVSQQPAAVSLAKSTGGSDGFSVGTSSGGVSERPSTPKESPFPTSDEPSHQPAPEEWYMKTPEGPTYGPVDRAELNRWVSEGRVAADCSLRCGDQSWRPAPEVYPSLSPAHAIGGGNAPGGYRGATGQAAAGYGATGHGGGGYGPRNAPGYSSQYPASAYARPHRGGLILALGIIGLVFGACPIPGVMAWVMGSNDLREMREGRMDPSGSGLTQAGQILGMIYSILWIISAVLIVFVMLVAAAAG